MTCGFRIRDVLVKLKPGLSPSLLPPAGTAQVLLQSLAPREGPVPRNVILSGSRVCLIKSSDFFYFQTLLTRDMIWSRYSGE